MAEVLRQEDLERVFPPGERLIQYQVPMPEFAIAADPSRGEGAMALRTADPAAEARLLPLVRRAHPDLGRLGVFWHTQGSGKSYSMAFFAEKVRRVVPGGLYLPGS